MLAVVSPLPRGTESAEELAGVVKMRLSGLFIVPHCSVVEGKRWGFHSSSAPAGSFSLCQGRHEATVNSETSVMTDANRITEGLRGNLPHPTRLRARRLPVGALTLDSSLLLDNAFRTPSDVRWWDVDYVI